jgi:PAS domain S-box-containing protein
MRRFSLGTRIAAILLLFGLLATAYTALVWMPETARLAKSRMMVHISKHVDTISNGLAAPLFERRIGAIHEVLDRERTNTKEWISIVLTDRAGRRIFPLEAPPKTSDENIQHLKRAVTHGGQVLGYLTVAINTHPLLAAQRGQESRLAAFLIGALCLALLAIWIALDFMVQRPAQRLGNAAKRLSAGEFDAPLPRAGKGGMGDLVAAFSSMRDSIQTQQAALMESVEERRRAEQALTEANQWLDQRVRERTEEISRTNAALQQEVQERKRAEAEQRRSQDLFSGIIDNAPFNILFRDAEGIFRLANRHYLEAREVKADQIIGKTRLPNLAKELATKFDAQDQHVMQTGETLEFEDQIVFRDGVTHDLHITKFPVRDAEGGITGVGSISADITRLRAAEDQLRQGQKMRAVGQLTGGIAHDFNNLLGVILGNAQLLQEEMPGDNRFLEGVIKASLRGSQLTHRLLAFSRQQPLAPESTDINRLLEGTLTLLERTLGEPVELSFNKADGLWNADVDAAQLENALLNLVINARDAMPEGGRVTVETRNVILSKADIARLHISLETGDYVSVAVRDTGIGIPDEALEQVFEPFFTTKGVGEGSGLGLSMVYGFVTQSGGTVLIESEEGAGTTVTLYLRRSSEGAANDHAEVASQASPGGAEKILVLEDDDDVRELTQVMLQSLGYTVKTAADGASALSILESGEIVDLVLSDVVLKGEMSGPEFAKHARDLFPDIAVTYMSGYTAEEFRKTNQMNPDKDLIGKPFKKADLARHVRKALERNAAPIEAKAAAGAT